MSYPIKQGSAAQPLLFQMFQAAIGVRVLWDDEDGAWSDPDAALAAMGLQRVSDA